jgi:hypothetical protein
LPNPGGIIEIKRFKPTPVRVLKMTSLPPNESEELTPNYNIENYFE